MNKLTVLIIMVISISIQYIPLQNQYERLNYDNIFSFIDIEQDPENIILTICSFTKAVDDGVDGHLSKGEFPGTEVYEEFDGNSPPASVIVNYLQLLNPKYLSYN